jgi:hypothetical protein
MEAISKELGEPFETLLSSLNKQIVKHTASRPRPSVGTDQFSWVVNGLIQANLLAMLKYVEIRGLFFSLGSGVDIALKPPFGIKSEDFICAHAAVDDPTSTSPDFEVVLKLKNTTSASATVTRVGTAPILVAVSLTNLTITTNIDMDTLNDSIKVRKLHVAFDHSSAKPEEFFFDLVMNVLRKNLIGTSSWLSTIAGYSLVATATFVERAASLIGAGRLVETLL